MNNHTGSKEIANKLVVFLKQKLHIGNVPGILVVIATIALLYAFFSFEKDQYQLVAFFFMLLVLFALGLNGLLILIYKKYTVGRKSITGWKAYFLGGISIFSGWGLLILVWLYLNK
jgi:hypothetical protein